MGGTRSYAAKSRVHMHVKRRQLACPFLVCCLVTNRPHLLTWAVRSPASRKPPHSANRIIRLPVWSCTDVRRLLAAAHLCPASCGLTSQAPTAPGHRGGTRAGGNSRSEGNQAHQAGRSEKHWNAAAHSLAPASSAVAHSAPIGRSSVHRHARLPALLSDSHSLSAGNGPFCC